MRLLHASSWRLMQRWPCYSELCWSTKQVPLIQWFRTLNDASGRSYSRSYPVRRRSSSIRNSGGRSCWWRSRYSAISSSAFRIGSASTVAKKRRHTEKSPRLTAGASRDEEEAGIALSVSPNFDRYNHMAGFTLMM